MPESPSRSPGVAPDGGMELMIIGFGTSETATSSVPQDIESSRLDDALSRIPLGDFQPAPVASVTSSYTRNILTENIVHISEESVESSGTTQQHSPAERPLDGIALANGTNHHHGDPEDLSRSLKIRVYVAKNVRQHCAAFLYWLLMLCFAIFLCYYFYEVLLVVDPHVGKLNPKPANTNFIVAVLAQVFGGLMVAAYLEILNLVHLHRLSRPTGASMLEAGQLSTNALGTARVLLTPGKHRVWALLRVVLPILVIILGTVQKLGAGIIYQITPYNGTISVWGGLAAMNSTVLDFIPVSTMVVYFLSWTPNLLSVPQFIFELPSTRECTGSCVAYMQPGGVNIPRLRDNSSLTLLDTGHFESADAIQIYNAPAIITEFDLPPSDSQFEIDDCQLFTPISNDAINVCIRPTNSGAVIGWTICPSEVYFNSSCTTNLTWTTQIGQVTTVTTYTQLTTTSYYGQNLSIINIKPTSAMEPLPINIEGFKSTWAKIFDPGNDTSPIANPFMVNAFQFELGFYLRLETDDFPNDQQSPLQILRNFITVPLQFSTSALLYLNATVEGFNLPDDMQATATAAMGRWRWKAQLWTVTLWIGVAGILVTSSGAIVLWILIQEPVAVKSTAFPFLDNVCSAGPGCKFADLESTLADLVHEQKLAEKTTGGLIRFFGTRKGYLIRAECETHGATHSAVVVKQEV